jgi:hypothetical protein
VVTAYHQAFACKGSAAFNQLDLECREVESAGLTTIAKTEPHGRRRSFESPVAYTDNGVECDARIPCIELRSVYPDDITIKSFEKEIARLGVHLECSRTGISDAKGMTAKFSHPATDYAHARRLSVR